MKAWTKLMQHFFSFQLCTELRHLELDWSDEIGFDPDDHSYKTGITKVSKFLGFDLIPGLKVLIRGF